MTTDERVDELFLEHFGVKGMRWGVRKERSVSTDVHKDVGVVRRQTKVRAAGGESHPATEDAIKAAVQKQKLKKSGPAALTTPELRELATRLQLEGQVAVLSSAKGKRFVTRQLELEGESAFRTGVRAGVGKGVKRTAKVGAVAAVV